MIFQAALRAGLFAAIAFTLGTAIAAARTGAVSPPALLDAAVYAGLGGLFYGAVRLVIAWANE
jgi:hypothetical protein